MMIFDWLEGFRSIVYEGEIDNFLFIDFNIFKNFIFTFFKLGHFGHFIFNIFIHFIVTPNTFFVIHILSMIFIFIPISILYNQTYLTMCLVCFLSIKGKQNFRGELNFDHLVHCKSSFTDSFDGKSILPFLSLIVQRFPLNFGWKSKSWRRV